MTMNTCWFLWVSPSASFSAALQKYCTQPCLPRKVEGRPRGRPNLKGKLWMPGERGMGPWSGKGEEWESMEGRRKNRGWRVFDFWQELRFGEGGFASINEFYLFQNRKVNYLHVGKSINFNIILWIFPDLLKLKFDRIIIGIFEKFVRICIATLLTSDWALVHFTLIENCCNLKRKLKV